LRPSPLEPDATEEIETFWCNREDIELMIEKNEINDGLSLAAWAMAKHLI
jgi:hypothetical protein